MKRNVKRHAVVQPQDQSIKLIPLTQGQVTVVDAIEYESLSLWAWFAWRNNANSCYYAVHDAWDPETKRNVRIYMARHIMNAPPDLQVDHINRNTLDNRRANLRLATQSQNQHNRPKWKKRVDGFKGVYQNADTKMWYACIWVNNKSVYLGQFADEISAAIAYNEAAVVLHGEFACLNQI